MSERRSVWLATAERESYPPLQGDVDADVVVVGGGITGLTTALLIQRDGARVAVVEADRVGGGTTGGTTGKVTSQHTLTYATLVDRHGPEKARLYAEANQAAIEIVAELADDTSADCQLVRAPAFLYTREPSERRSIEAEHDAASRLGLPVSLTTDVDLPFPVEIALRFDDQAHFHPTRYTAALARAIVAGGGRIFEHSRALNLEEEDDRVTVGTREGRVHAEHAVVATLIPFIDRGGFFAKQRPTRAYGVAARLAGSAPQGMHITAGSPTWSTRPWHHEGRPGLIVVGQNHATGHGEVTSGAWGELERWAREHFDVESFEYRWSAQDYSTVDEMPYVGRSPRTERTYVATGFKKWGLTNGTAAARILADLLAGRENPWLEAFDATRIGDARTVLKLIEDNAHVGKRFVVDRLERLRAESIAHLQPGEGGMAKVDGDAVGAFRDPDGTVHAVSLTCSHLGCTVRWNGAENSWDCPCHGSRFGHDGEVLNGPATEPLERIEVEGD